MRVQAQDTNIVVKKVISKKRENLPLKHVDNLTNDTGTSAISCRNRITQPQGMLLAAIMLIIRQKVAAWWSSISIKSPCFSPFISKLTNSPK